MSKLDQDYLDLLRDISENGITKGTRSGEVKSVFGRYIRHNMSDGFPMLTTKKLPFKTIVTELLWFLKGDTNIKYLVDNGCHIWDGDAYKNYLASPLATIRDFRSNELYKNLHNGWCVLNGRSFSAPHPTRHLTHKEFIEKIKTDDVFAERWGDLGSIYGKQWREWSHYREVDPESGQMSEYRCEDPIDQIENLINDLKTNPDSRRLMVSAWNVAELDKMVLPPCHYSFQVYTRELSLEERAKWLQNTKGYDLLLGRLDHDHVREIVENESPTRAISLMWNQRSVDVPLGLPFNIASYGLLLMMLGKQVNMIPEELIGNLGDCHIYKNQVDGVNEQLLRESYDLPTVEINGKVSDLRDYYMHNIELKNYVSGDKIYFPLSN